MAQDKKNQILRLGESLLNSGLVNETQMALVLQKQSATGERLGELMVRLGIVSEHDLAMHLADQTGVEFADIDLIPKPDAGLLRLFNQEFCLHRAFLPLQREGDELLVIIGNADMYEVEQAVKRKSGLSCKIVQGEFSKISQAIRENYFFFENPIEVLFAKEVKRIERDVDQVLSPDLLIDYLLHLAVQQRATDIHLQPEPKSIHILFRIDGVLQPIFAMPLELRRLLAAIKRHAGMDISDQLRPQDGSFSVEIISMPFDLRVSTLISEYGENIVMRLLPSGMHVKGLNELGFFQKDLDELAKMFLNPHGILLMTGPTGSGKSTTLHAGLRSTGMVGKNIVTVEDPIEYKLPTICQTQVNRKAGYDFASAIRQFLRHDPDVMLIGEIRDGETAHAAITAAETGHLVLSTLHVNNVLGVLSRLQSLDIPQQMIADSLIGVVNQRLARKICMNCQISYTPTDEELVYFPKENADFQLFRGTGCPHCKGTGYYGRIPLYEILNVDAKLQAMIASDASRIELMRQMKDANFIPIEEMSLQQVAAGNTTLEEVRRLLGNTLEGSIG